MKKVIQYFSDDYLESCRKATPEQIIQFIEDYRSLQSEILEQKSKSTLISIKIPENLLQAFRFLCNKHGVPYQTQMKILMKKWIQSF